MQIKVLSRRLSILPMIDLMNKSRMTGFETGRKRKKRERISRKLFKNRFVVNDQAFFRAFGK